MVELRILGGVRLTASDGGDVEHLTSRAKRLAVLAYLASALPRGMHRRDKLLALFWPELDGERARAALSQTLYVLRSALGPDAITSSGAGDVGLSASAVWCDAVEFDEMVDAGRGLEALELYRGDLLDGFFIAGAPDFEQWLDAERERLRRRASEAAWAVAEAKAEEGDAFGAARHARRAAELAPGDEAEARRLMVFLHRLGDRASAIRAYDALAERLAREYDLKPSGETQALAAAVRREDPGSEAAGSVEAAAAALTAGRGGHAPETPPADLSASAPERGVEPARPRASAQRRAGLAWAGSVVAAALAAVLLWPSFRGPEPTPPPPMQFRLDFPGVNSLLRASLQVALSPSGESLVARGNGENGLQLFLRPMAQAGVAIPIPHTLGAEDPFFSPDGEWLGFVRGASIYRMRLGEGVPIPIATLRDALPHRPSWGSNAVIVFQTPAGLWRVPSSGGEATPVALADTLHGERYRFPTMLPGGSDAVLTRFDGTTFHLAAVSLETGAVRDLGLDGSSPIFVAPDLLLFTRTDGTLLTVPFDRRSVRVTGAPQPTGQRALVMLGGRAEVAVSASGALAYVPPWPADKTLVIVDRNGEVEAVGVPPGGFEASRVSPDGRRAATTLTDAHRFDVWVVDLERHRLERLTFDGVSLGPDWSPDGRRIAFQRNPGGGMRFAWIEADGGHAETLLDEGRPRQSVNDFTPDGSALVFQRVETATDFDIWVLSLEGTRAAWPYLETAASERGASLSPDGRWLAYTSDESGRDEVYVRAFPTSGPPVKISLDGGRAPRWAPSGSEVFYWSWGNGTMIAARVSTHGTVRVEGRETLFGTEEYQVGLDKADYDVLPDERFLMIRRGSEREQVVIELNWVERLREGAR